MVKTAAAARTTELDPIDRLEEKVRRLVQMIAQLRAEQARAAGDNARLVQDLDAMRARLADADAAGSELTALRDERDLVRARVAEMLEQLEAI